jgi:hypothetical protein
MAKLIRYGMVGGDSRAFIGEVHRNAIGFDNRAKLVAGCFSTNPDNLQICADGACINGLTGFARGNFPSTCQQNQTNQTNQSNQTNQTCFNSVGNIPAVCTGGTITEDTDLNTFDNCRHITCSNGNNSLQVKACDKPDESTPMFFEMYRIGQAGQQQLQICIDDVCLRSNDFQGFARSGNFPICIGNVTPPVVANTSVEMSIAPFYPQGRSYVFICTAHGFTPTSYSWFFDDGQKLLDVANNNVFHTYGPGMFTPVCTATDGVTTEAATLHITVS